MILVEASLIVISALMIYQMWKINNSINNFKIVKRELAQLMHNFDEATLRAEMSISELRDLNSKTQEEINDKIEKAKYLSNDLAFLSDKALEITNKIDQKIAITEKKIKTLNFQDNKKVEPIFTKKNNFSTNSYLNKKQEVEYLLEKISKTTTNKKPNINKAPYSPSIKKHKEFFNQFKRTKENI